MTRFFNKFGRIAVVVVLSAIVPNVSFAGKHGGGNHSFNGSMKSSGGQVRNMQFKSLNSVKSHNNFNSSNYKSVKTSPNWSKPVKLQSNVNTQKFTTKKFTPNVLGKSSNTTDAIRLRDRSQIKYQGNLLGTKNPGFIKNPGKIVNTKKPGIIKSPIGPLVGNSGGKVGPLPGGMPIDPGPGNGNPIGGQGNGGKGNCHNNNCHQKCPWPIFWPVYRGYNYWNTPCYYGSTYRNPTVIVNEVPPTVVNEVVPVSAEMPVSTDANVASSPDLVLEDIEYAQPATLLVGPAYRVKFRNQGLAAAGKFRVALIAAVDAQANEQSPQAMVEVSGLASGESAEVIVRLPNSAMQLTNSTGQSSEFTHLLVAADFDNLVTETDKTNNVAIVARTQLEVAAK